jgi:chemotaxis protein MotA
MIPQLIFSILLSVAIFFAAFHLKVGEMGLASNLNALMIVLGGTFAATLIAYPWEKIIWTLRPLKKAFLAQKEIDWTIKKIVDLARAYRQGGIRILEQRGEGEFMDHEVIRLELIQEGVLDLYDKENPRAIRFKLEALSAAVMNLNPTRRRPEFVSIPPKKRASSVLS